MAKIEAAHLVERAGVKYCSACRMTFPDDAQPSLSKAFTNHVRENHRTAPSTQPQSVENKKKMFA